MITAHLLTEAYLRAIDAALTNLPRKQSKVFLAALKVIGSGRSTLFFSKSASQ